MRSDKAGFRIIRAGAKHAALAAPLFDAYRQFYKLRSNRSAAEKFLSERLRRGQSVLFLALRKSGRGRSAIGFVHLYPTFSSLRLKPVWVLNDLYVVPEARGQGVGGALMEVARKLALRTGACKLVLETGRDNRVARRLYEQLGYEREREFYTYSLRVR